MRIRLTRWTAILACLFCLFGSSWAGLGHGFRLEPVESGLTDPVAMAATPFGDVLIAERTTGQLRRVRHGVLEASALCSVTVDNSGGRGLLGVAVHPDFAINRFIYLYYSAGAGVNKVTRFVLGAGGCSAPFDVLSDLGSSASGLRNGGGLAFAPDGTLIVSTGDLEDSQNGQADGVLFGKILRINDDGSIPADNPTPGSAVYAKGVRNGVGVAVNEAGTIYAADAGSDADSSYDEINHVPAGGNLGWDSVTGDSGGSFDDPLDSWSPVIGVGMISAYAGTAFPSHGQDGIDNDHDKYGPDRFPGDWRIDDNSGTGVCVGSDNNGLPCTSDNDCPPRLDVGFGLFNEASYCEFLDDDAEWCPGGVPAGDDGCDDTGGVGVDEPNEDYAGNLFVPAAGGGSVLRVSLDPADDTAIGSTDTFIDSSRFSDCPTGWTAALGAADGSLLLLADNGGGGGNGALYRVVYDAETGPREVSAPGSPMPLTVDKAGGDQVVVRFEDLRSDAVQPRDAAGDPMQPAREYTAWVGDLGSFSSHNPVAGQDGVAGTLVNDSLREITFDSGSGDKYFLISARSDNYNGTTGFQTGGTERAGFATRDLCDTIGEYSSANGWAEFDCGRDFTTVDEHGESFTLSELRGHPVLLDFSAIWCPPCHDEADVLNNLYEDYKDRGVMVVTVLFDEDANGPNWWDRPMIAECRNWGDRDGSNPDHLFPCVIDPLENDGGTGQRNIWPYYNAFGAVPTNTVLDTGGRVAYAAAGYPESTIRSQLDLLVGTVDSCFDQ